MNGKFKWYKKEKGYGFITGEDGKDYFVHFSALPKDQLDIKESEGLKVSFEVITSERTGKPQAVEIKFQ